MYYWLLRRQTLHWELNVIPLQQYHAASSYMFTIKLFWTMICIKTEIPKEICKLNNLRALSLFHNELTGEIPKGIQEMKYYKYFKIKNWILLNYE